MSNETKEELISMETTKPIPVVNKSDSEDKLFSTLRVFESIKSAISTISTNQQLFEQSLSIINQTTQFINANTGVVVVFDVSKLNELLQTIDEVVCKNLAKLDDGCDNLRSKLSLALLELLDAVVAHKKYAEDVIGDVVKTRFEQSRDFMRAAVAFAQEMYPKARDDVVTYAQSSSVAKIINREVSIQESAVTVAAALLTAAQPYVHDAYKRGEPLVLQTLDAYHPYIEKSKPFVDSVIVKASNINKQLQDNNVVGPYVVRAVDTASFALETTMVYCVPPAVAQQ